MSTCPDTKPLANVDTQGLYRCDSVCDVIVDGHGMYSVNKDNVKQCLDTQEINACTHFYFRE